MATAKRSVVKKSASRSAAAARKQSAAATPARERVRSATTTVAKLMERYPPAVRDLVEALRELIQAEVPQALEAAYGGWRVIMYDADGMYCYVGPRKDGANVGFHRGTDLSDPAKLLTGTGRKMRHIKLAAGATIPRAALRKLVRQAADLNRRGG